MAADSYAAAMIPQPFVTVAGTKLQDFSIALSLTDEWERLNNDSKLITAALIVRSGFADEHPAALQTFLKEYAASVDYVNANVDEAAEMIEKLDIVKAQIAKTALPFCNLVCITGEEMKASASAYLKVLFDQKSESVGGKLPDDDFYLIY